MSPGTGAPRTDAVISTDEILAREGGIVAVGPTLDQLAVYLGPPIAALVVGAERVAEGARGRREEWRGEGPRGALGEEGDARLEAVGQPGRWRRYGPGLVLFAYIPVVVLTGGSLCVLLAAASVRCVCGTEGGC
jgi:hypothetical protein